MNDYRGLELIRVFFLC